MYSIINHYAIEWIIVGYAQYRVTSCGKVINIRTGRILKRTINNRSVGYWIGKKFYSLKSLRVKLQRISKETFPF